MERKMGEWEKRVQRFEESRKGGQKRAKDVQEADRAEEFPGKKGRVEVEKGENDKEQRGVRREREKQRRRMKKGKKRGKRQKMEIK